MLALLEASGNNILDAQGTVDLSQRTMEKLDIIIASLHTPCMTPGSRQENTDAYLNAMKIHVSISSATRMTEDTKWTTRHWYREQKNTARFWN